MEVGGGNGGISEFLIIPCSDVCVRLSRIICGDCMVLNGPVEKLCRAPKLGSLKLGDLGVRIRLSTPLPETCLSSAMGDACAALLAMDGKPTAAAPKEGEVGRPDLVVASIWSWFGAPYCDEGLRIPYTPRSLEEGRPVWNGGSLLVEVAEVAEPSGGRLVLAGAGGGRLA